MQLNTLVMLSKTCYGRSMTVCNTTIEAGARAGLIAVDDKTIEYVKNKEIFPTNEQLNSAIEYWKTLKTDENATYDKVISIIEMT